MTASLVTSTSNPAVKQVIRLRNNRFRRREGKMLVDGWREIRRALESGLAPRAIFSVPHEKPMALESDDSIAGCEQWVRNDAHESIVHVNAKVMEKIGYGNSSRGAVAEFDAITPSLDDVMVVDSLPILILDHFEKPGNIGAVFRSADAAGIGGIVLCPKTTDVFNPNTIRSSLGAVFTVPFAVADEHQTRKWLRARGYAIITMRVAASVPIWQCDLTRPTAVVIGNEAEGLQSNWQSSPGDHAQSVHIPMDGRVDSLNASVTAAVVLFESQRQRAERGSSIVD